MKRASHLLRTWFFGLALLTFALAAVGPVRADARRATTHGPRKLTLYTGCALSIAVAHDPRGLLAALSGCITLMIHES